MRDRSRSELSQFKPRVIIFWLIAALLLVSSGWTHWKYGVNGIGVFGSYASVLGLIVTFYVAEWVGRVRDRYAVRVTMMQNFERFRSAVSRFEQASAASEIRAIAGELEPLICELRVHLNPDVGVESLLTSLKELMETQGSRDVQNAKTCIPPLLRQFTEYVKIHRDKDEWRRDHA